MAKDWFSPDLASLGALSFKEHEELAEKENGGEKWAYAKSVTVSYETRARIQRRSGDWLAGGTSRADLVRERSDARNGDSPPWLRRVEGDGVELVDDGQGTAVL